ncbi:hypothetical protein Bca52824_082937 [Brassica carinata]|uniref:Uncharacterized protein n=1 Tax=Brassica carinata TaxID=52824 RepID=A0A8X7TUS0_BRACI|nr:hypothetical protein Bca52824_082937 [Brassica carinata]
MFLPSEKKAPETKSQRQEDDLEKAQAIKIVGGMIKTIYNDETQTIQRVMLRILIGSYTQFSEVDRAEYQSSTTATRQWNSGYQSISNSRDSS